MENIRVKSIEQRGDRGLCITWTDDLETIYDVVELRRQCPCAGCIDEMSGRRTLRPEVVADDVRPIRIDSVGRYALTIRFSDGHGTGIYTYPYLREIARLQQLAREAH